MTGSTILTLVLVVFMIGWTAGSGYQTWTVHYRNLAAMTTRYEAERNWINARTAELLAELDQETEQVKQDLKRQNNRYKEKRKHGK